MPPERTDSAAAGELAQHLARRICAAGPLTVDAFMSAVLTHPRHGYYVARQPFGRDGDFITSPEVSQMFGELLGVWCAHTWDVMGRPPLVRLAELGPGRGTLMSDLLRAAASQAGFRAAAKVHLVELSQTLAHTQRMALAGSGYDVTWHTSFAEVPEGPLLLVANELFDALPVRQFVRTVAGWRERLVDADDRGGFQFVVAAAPGPGFALLPPEVRDAPVGAVAEVSPGAIALVSNIAARVAKDGGAALIIDYGSGEFGARDTLQGVARHKPHPVLENPGIADICAHVDFAVLRRAAEESGAKVWGPVTQGAFLHQLGIGPRAARLSAKATSAQKAEIESALARLIGPEGMGGLFKVLCVAHPGHPAPAGFAP